MKWGPLAGPPLVRGDSLIGVSTGGEVWRLDAKTGEEQPWTMAEGKQERLAVGEGMGAGGVLFGDRLLLTGRDAVLCLIALPE